uniref:Uncharacterized protein n=1 Tax=Rhizophora mucronata TaxID=61149 RepID=A0A2P2LXH5_RHIMU
MDRMVCSMKHKTNTSFLTNKVSPLVLRCHSHKGIMKLT